MSFIKKIVFTITLAGVVHVFIEAIGLIEFLKGTALMVFVAAYMGTSLVAVFAMLALLLSLGIKVHAQKTGRKYPFEGMPGVEIMIGVFGLLASGWLFVFMQSYILNLWYNLNCIYPGGCFDEYSPDVHTTMLVSLVGLPIFLMLLFAITFQFFWESIGLLLWRYFRNKD